jgi:hypothetical protein
VQLVFSCRPSSQPRAPFQSPPPMPISAPNPPCLPATHCRELLPCGSRRLVLSCLLSSRPRAPIQSQPPVSISAPTPPCLPAKHCQHRLSCGSRFLPFRRRRHPHSRHRLPCGSQITAAKSNTRWMLLGVPSTRISSYHLRQAFRFRINLLCKPTTCWSVDGTQPRPTAPATENYAT